MTDKFTIGERDVFLVVDLQNDFCPGGGLPVPHGDEVVPLINGLAGEFAHVVLTQDWHPRGHLSFASSHPGKKPYQTIEVGYGTQVLWPDHCVQGTCRRRVPPRLGGSPRRAGTAQGLSPRYRFLFGVLRKRSQDPYRAGRVSARARLRAGLSRRPRIRFLRALFGGGCVPRGFPGDRDRGCLPRHRRRWLHGRHA